MLIPDVVGFKLSGKLREGITATDLVLTVTQMLRKHGVVGKFVEFYGDGLDSLPLADRATIANMSPEYGATCGFFRSMPLRWTICALPGAAKSRWRWWKPMRAQGMWRQPEMSRYSPAPWRWIEQSKRAWRTEAPAGPRSARRCPSGLCRQHRAGSQPRRKINGQ